MTLATVNPATGERVRLFAERSEEEIQAALGRAEQAAQGWGEASFASREAVLRKAAATLRAGARDYAQLITLEMGKPVRESTGEIEKCALACDYYADHGAALLADERVETDATRSLVAYQPIGPVLAVMPWNFPFWQVFRFAAPALAAGNVALVKLASNVPQCSLAIEEIWTKAGAPPGVLQSLLIGPDRVEGLIGDARVRAVTLTGSEAAGRKVAAIAGAHLKKTVLELGGSDPFVVLQDADLELAVRVGVASRFLNGGQSCIAAKRFIIVPEVAEEFLARFVAAAQALHVGDPRDDRTMVGPLARGDLRDALQVQVDDAIARGARVLAGGSPLPGPGYFYPPTVLDGVGPGMRAYREELFGPVAAVIRARNEDDARRIANDTPYGLGASVWSRDTARAEAFGRRLACGSAFVNGLVKSDPRLPFGGVKRSGYGRELSAHGIREFVNIKTIWVA
ncbi:MAG: NAD-dependent succinate-semialdehyde dehydrogenase [Acidiferrobacteraceae bacterium]